jgi:hypothetical protein
MVQPMGGGIRIANSLVVHEFMRDIAADSATYWIT